MAYNRKAYKRYIRDVLDGKIVAGKRVRLACQRALDFEQRDDMYFDEEDVDRRIALIYKLKHYDGAFNGMNFELLPWQQFVISQIFGWKWRKNDLRVTRTAFCMLSRKCGKTALAAAIALSTIICDREHGAEVDFIANNVKQATLCFKHTSNFAESIDPNHILFQRYRGEIRIPTTKSVIQVLSSDSLGLDGFSSSLTIFDELHAQKNWDLWNVMKSSQGARQQPLMMAITTAGFQLGQEYPCYSLWQTCCDVLNKTKEDDTLFSFIAQLDDEDDWQDRKVWKKCCPSMNQTVSEEYIRSEIQTALNTPSLEVGVKTKTLNMWCQSQKTWISRDIISHCMHNISLDDFKGEPAYMGVDLSVVNDLTSFAVLLPPNKEREKYKTKYIFKTFLFIPDEAIQTSPNSSIYKEWIRCGYAFRTPGNVVDYDEILRQQLKISSQLTLYGVFYDAYNATQWAINATNEGLTLTPYSQGLASFNRPTKQFEVLIKSGKVIIDKNPALLWCFGNVELKYDWNDNCKPIKANHSDNNKIDPVIAILESLGGYMAMNKYSPMVYDLDNA